MATASSIQPTWVAMSRIDAHTDRGGASMTVATRMCAIPRHCKVPAVFGDRQRPESG